MATKTKANKAKAPAPRKGRGITLVSPKTPGATRIDFTNQTGATRTVDGTFQDLIVDGHGHPAKWLCNAHANPKDNKAAFLMGRGWSATLEKREEIADAGLPVMAINDWPKDGPKPWYWCAGDPPGFYSERVWTDSDVMKFVGLHNAKAIRPRESAYAPACMAKDAPNTFFFHQATDEMDVDHWLFHPFIVWGSTIGCEGGPKQLYAHGAARSSMLIGLKILWFLGYRRIYLLGCDCTPHHHPASEYWNTIFHLMGQLAPGFRRWGLQVYQTNPDAYLRTFPFAHYRRAWHA